jgi:hypothetical protein
MIESVARCPAHMRENNANVLLLFYFSGFLGTRPGRMARPRLGAIDTLNGSSNAVWCKEVPSVWRLH